MITLNARIATQPTNINSISINYANLDNTSTINDLIFTAGNNQYVGEHIAYGLDFTKKLQRGELPASGEIDYSPIGLTDINGHTYSVHSYTAIFSTAAQVVDFMPFIDGISSIESTTNAWYQANVKRNPNNWEVIYEIYIPNEQILEEVITESPTSAMNGKLHANISYITNVSPYQITIQGKDIQSLFIEFDLENNIYPPYILMNATRYPIYQPQFKINFSQPTSEITITISEINNIGQSLIINKISDIDENNFIEIDKKYLIEADSNLISCSDYSTISYGMFSNNSSFSISDKNGIFAELIKNKQIQKGHRCEFYLYNTISNSKTITGVYFVKNVDYDFDNRECEFELGDGLQELQNIEISPFFVSSLGQYYGIEVYRRLKKLTPAKFNIMDEQELDSNTKNRLTNGPRLNKIIISSNNLWGAWNEFAEAFFLNIHKLPNNKTICIYRGEE